MRRTGLSRRGLPAVRADFDPTASRLEIDGKQSDLWLIVARRMTAPFNSVSR